MWYLARSPVLDQPFQARKDLLAVLKLTGQEVQLSAGDGIGYMGHVTFRAVKRCAATGRHVSLVGILKTLPAEAVATGGTRQRVA